MTKLTDSIFQTTTPYNNGYQNFKQFPRYLFVCSAGLLRSATGANLYAKKGYNTRNAGTHDYALIPLSANLIAWADKIIFVNEENYEQALLTFNDHMPSNEKLRDKSVTLTLDIPDDYAYNDPQLIAEFERQMGE
jgi:predicted protein tyrosine phosphatase